MIYLKINENGSGYMSATIDVEGKSYTNSLFTAYNPDTCGEMAAIVEMVNTYNQKHCEDKTPVQYNADVMLKESLLKNAEHNLEVAKKAAKEVRI